MCQRGHSFLLCFASARHCWFWEILALLVQQDYMDMIASACYIVLCPSGHVLIVVDGDYTSRGWYFQAQIILVQGCQNFVERGRAEDSIVQVLDVDNVEGDEHHAPLGAFPKGNIEIALAPKPYSGFSTLRRPSSLKPI